MPFVGFSEMEQRVALMRDHETGAFSVTDLCVRYGIDRTTFYLWAQRRAGGDAAWFVDRSRAPHGCPHRTAAEVADAAIELRRRFAHFGPKKVRARLLEMGLDGVPAASTIGDILKRAGLVTPRRRHRRAVSMPVTGEREDVVNAEWACDFKGWFRTRDGRRCDPLTVSDGCSRYLLDVRIVEPTIGGVRPVFERLFGDHGLPCAIRCDNGPPFGSDGAGGLTRLSAWWLTLGIEPHFIRPGAPQDNGRHERMHRELKAHTSRPAAWDFASQQRRFDEFRHHYNEERPHEALGQRMPGKLWKPSTRPMPVFADTPWYDADHEVRHVRTSGEIKWRQSSVFVSEALIGEPVGLIERDDGTHLVRFCTRELGIIDHKGRFRRFAPPRYKLREAAKTAPDCGGCSRSNL